VDAGNPETLLMRGAQALRAGQLTAAIAAYAALVELRPDLPNAWFNLGWAQRAARQFNEALDAYANAIAAGIARPEEAHVNRAAILADHLRQPEAAIAELHAALALNSRFVPAWLSLGTVFEDLGRPDDARHAYRSTLRSHPGNGRAHARLAAMDVTSGHAAAAVATLHDALPAAATLDDRAEILFGLGTAYDALARYDGAMQAFQAANHIARSLNVATYDPAAQERLVDRIIEAFPRPLSSPHQGSGSTPVFICGMFRSGSTLAEHILGRHPAVAALGELETIPALVQSRLLPYPESVSTLTQEQQAMLRADYVAERGPVSPNKRVVTDKRCDNFLHIGLIKLLMPEARIIETVRQPLDNLLSAYFLRFGEGVAYAHDLGDAAHFYIQYRRLMAHWHRLFPDDIEVFDYDRAVVDPRATVGALLASLGLPWDDACLAPDRATRAVRTASTWQVREPLHTRSSGRSRHYERHLADVRARLAAAGL
jgi:tetratricopeptide (TPR) repeat protein